MGRSREIENGYWYLDRLKDFAERIGIPAAVGAAIMRACRGAGQAGQGPITAMPLTTGPSCLLSSEEEPLSAGLHQGAWPESMHHRWWISGTQ
jgi:hypothetical protein